ncbi:hypothetical protein LVJ94_39540 [Pendulispora rubella]|uniref:Uncharacterized protein n=1 Tax=Pendulispora rubella TaxID=2741070 RepID=A0ABZ2KWQ8_9BACT
MRMDCETKVGRWLARGSVAAVLASLFAVGLVQGCGDDDPAAPKQDSGPPDTGKPDTGTDAGTDAQGDADPGPQPKKLALSKDGTDRLLNVTFDSAGNLYAVGIVSTATGANADFETAVIKVLPSGETDTSFGGPGANGVARKNIVVGKNGELARGIAIQRAPVADGGTEDRIVVGATVDLAADAGADPRDRDIALVRFKMDGTLDDAFGTGGVATFNLKDGIEFPTTLPDGGASTGYTADSQWGLAALPNGSLIVTGSQRTANPNAARTDSDFAVIKVDSQGKKLDDTFGQGGSGVFTYDPDRDVDAGWRSASPRAVTLLENGSIVATGYQPDTDGKTVVPTIFKLTPAGALDPSFGTNGVFSKVLGAVTEAYAVVQQGTNFVTVGYGREVSTNPNDIVSVRVNASGQLDGTYGTGGKATLDGNNQVDQGRNLVVLPDSRLFVVGNGQQTKDVGEALTAVFTANGQPDTNYAPKGRKLYDLGGTGDVFWGVALSPDKKKIAIVGYSSAVPTGSNEDSFLLLVPVP